MVLSSTPVAAIAAETTQNTSEGATAAASTGVKTVTFVAENGGGAFADGSIVMRIQTNDKAYALCRSLPCAMAMCLAAGIMTTLARMP